MAEPKFDPKKLLETKEEIFSVRLASSVKQVLDELIVELGPNGKEKFEEMFFSFLGKILTAKDAGYGIYFRGPDGKDIHPYWTLDSFGRAANRPDPIKLIFEKFLPEDKGGSLKFLGTGSEATAYKTLFSNRYPNSSSGEIDLKVSVKLGYISEVIKDFINSDSDYFFNATVSFFLYCMEYKKKGDSVYLALNRNEKGLLLIED